MRSFLALIRREYLEHRGAFLYGPFILTGLLALAAVAGTLSGKLNSRFGLFLPDFQTLFEVGYGAVCWGWWYYLVAVLFFYYADAFNADRRNNSMLFWKSMPQSDFKILMSKMIAGLTLFPLLIFVCMLLSGMVVFGIAVAASFTLPNLILPGIAAASQSWLHVSLVAFVYLLITLVWYAPFFAWVGALSTAFGRWSIPLSLLIPGVLALFENVLISSNAPTGGFLYHFLSQRSEVKFGGEDIASLFLPIDHIDAMAIVARMLTGTNWLSVLGGLVFAVLAIYAASAYRRRSIAA